MICIDQDQLFFLNWKIWKFIATGMGNNILTFRNFYFGILLILVCEYARLINLILINSKNVIIKVLLLVNWLQQLRKLQTPTLNSREEANDFYGSTDHHTIRFTLLSLICD